MAHCCGGFLAIRCGNFTRAACRRGTAPAPEEFTQNRTTLPPKWRTRPSALAEDGSKAPVAMGSGRAGRADKVDGSNSQQTRRPSPREKTTNTADIIRLSSSTSELNTARSTYQGLRCSASTKDGFKPNYPLRWLAIRRSPAQGLHQTHSLSYSALIPPLRVVSRCRFDWLLAPGALT
ncbi:hypothetical protein TESG_01338 [Trichophyton tonsurans CBS 112818]|uniref:Uncharacterized protein n=1 Tax=Trichophyton tonsurans (strain CBS 112818) TaxID=647933 RepID=F2RR56_TRIT1|nr:hypothetical protein TESG_01338 [Trichophyton tonsurans CBS 112818]